MENMATIIQRHNSKVLKPTSENDTKSCNCRNACPMNGNGDCRKENVIYKASITSDQTTKYYYGLSEPEFKTRYNNHTASFRHKHKEKETLLSRYIWQLKEDEKPYDISWSIVARAAPYRCGTRHCDLCLTEKLVISQADPETMLNKKSELISKCRHSNKYRLKSIKS